MASRAAGTGGAIMKCPVCLSPVEPRVYKIKDGFAYDLERGESKEQWIMSLLLRYWQMQIETPTEKMDYHSSVRWNADEKCYEFSIQTYDSPEGDHWWYGKFKYDRFDGVKIMSEEFTS